jgi:hypothetical protein
MTTYKNKNQKRDYDCTNVFFIQSNAPQNTKYWVVCDENEINCDQLYKQSYTENGIDFVTISYGKL